MNNQIEYKCTGCKGDICRIIVDEADGTPTHCPYGLSAEKHPIVFKEVKKPMDTAPQAAQRDSATRGKVNLRIIAIEAWGILKAYDLLTDEEFNTIAERIDDKWGDSE